MFWSELFAKLLLVRVINNYHVPKFFFHKPCCHSSFTECYSLCYQLLYKHILKIGLRAWFITSSYSISKNMIQVSAMYNNIQVTV